MWDLISRRSSEAPVEVSNKQPRPLSSCRHFFLSTASVSPKGRGNMPDGKEGSQQRGKEEEVKRVCVILGGKLVEAVAASQD